MTEPITTPASRRAVALDQARLTVAQLREGQVREEYAQLLVELGQLNDRYMAILRDRRVWSDRVRDAALWQARFHARSTLQAATRELPDPRPLLRVIKDLPDRPPVEDLQHLRMGAHLHGLRWAAWQEQRTPDEELVQLLRKDLRAMHHDSVVRWQAAGGVNDDGHATTQVTPGTAPGPAPSTT
jgi:hypothetical protein